MNHRTTLASLLGFALAVAAGACVKKDTNPPDGKAACTEEAKVCPDGSSVARTGPNCEFAECPAAADDKTDETPDPEATPDAPVEGAAPANG